MSLRHERTFLPTILLPFATITSYMDMLCVDLDAKLERQFLIIIQLNYSFKYIYWESEGGLC